MKASFALLLRHPLLANRPPLMRVAFHGALDITDILEALPIIKPVARWFASDDGLDSR